MVVLGTAIDWQLAAVITGVLGMSLFVFYQPERISRLRWGLAVAVLLAALAATVSADILIPNRCAELTMADLEYWILGCWGLPG